MKRLILVVVGLLVAGSVQAAEGTKYSVALGGFRTADGQVSGSAELVSYAVIACGGTACVAELYDITTGATIADASGKLELRAAANATAVVDLTDAPIRFSDGIYLNVDANVTAVSVLAERSRP